MVFNIRSPKGWELPERLAASEDTFRNRRKIMKAAGAGLLAAGAAPLVGRVAGARPAYAATGPTADLYPRPINPTFADGGRPVTPEDLATTYNNFYEFGSHKQISRAAQALEAFPWTVKVKGLVDKPMELDAEDLIRRMPLEERIYRLRCVEAWSIVVPWTGFAMRHLIKEVAPQSGAKYVKMTTFLNPEVATGQRQFWYPWPYVEGITMEEAMNDLTFLVTGAYGKPVPDQMGAPIRLALPWKYGFKWIKSIVEIEFTDTRPVSFWEELQASEYGFWANVNPEIDHPRWTQATERDLETGDRIPTLKWNGYGAFVAGMYDKHQGEGDRLYR